jgi:polyhydroxybutyrate depolymerase
MTTQSRTGVRRSTIVVVVVALTLATGSCSSDPAALPSTGSAPSAGTTPPGSAVATSTHATGPSAGCPSAGHAGGTLPPSGNSNETFTSGGKERTYQLNIPDGYDGTKPYAIVFGLHSLTVDYRIVPGMSGFADMAKTYDFIGVSPSGLISSVPYWNAAPVADNYDVAVLTELLDHLEATLCVDTGKVFSVGMSNGAQMSSLLACRLPDRITAIAPIAGVEFNDPCTGAPVPVMAFHGVADPIVPYGGGGLNSVTIANQNFYKGNVPAGVATPTGVDESMRRWAEHNGCDADVVETRISPEVRKHTWQHCDAATVLYLVDNGGHAWPGKPQPAFEKAFGHGTTEIDATSLLFAFFFDQPS